MSSNTYKIFNNKKLTIIPPCSNTEVCLKTDSGASKSYIRPVDQSILHQQKIDNGPKVQIPNGTNINTIKKGILPLHAPLSSAAKKASVLEGLSNATLLSIGQLWDENCIAVFDKHHLRIFKKGLLII